jgi:hypothetical protein
VSELLGEQGGEFGGRCFGRGDCLLGARAFGLLDGEQRGAGGQRLVGDGERGLESCACDWKSGESFVACALHEAEQDGGVVADELAEACESVLATEVARLLHGEPGEEERADGGEHGDELGPVLY